MMKTRTRCAAALGSGLLLILGTLTKRRRCDQRPRDAGGAVSLERSPAPPRAGGPRSPGSASSRPPRAAIDGVINPEDYDAVLRSSMPSSVR